MNTNMDDVIIDMKQMEIYHNSDQNKLNSTRSSEKTILQRRPPTPDISKLLRNGQSLTHDVYNEIACIILEQNKVPPNSE